MRRTLLLAVTSLIATFAFAEGLLRLQQALGPFYDLEFHSLGSLPSEELNHVHAAREDWVLRDAATYGDHAGHRYTARYDADGVRRDRFRASADSAPTRILLLGDSFVEGYDDDNTLGAHVWRTLAVAGRPTAVSSAGASSYSPLLFTLQARRLLPKLRPDFVVVVIDETDLGDDYLRYRQHVVRDDTGRLVAVRSSPALRDFVGGFLDIKRSRHWFYTVRLARRLYHARVRSATQSARAAIDAVDPLVFARDVAAPDAPAARAFFAHSLDELIETLVDGMGSSERVLLVTHPHLEHLVGGDDGQPWPAQVSLLVAAAAQRHGVAHYDATQDLQTAFGSRATAYYWRGDMHFNFAGLRLYGEALGADLLRRLPPPRP